MSEEDIRRMPDAIEKFEMCEWQEGNSEKAERIDTELFRAYMMLIGFWSFLCLSVVMI